MSAVLSFRDWVSDTQAQTSAKRKGERTRDRIKLAAIDLLNGAGYRDLKIGEICARAGVTPPVLYLYYPGKLALAEEVLREFLDHYIARPGPERGKTRSAYEAMYQANLDWLSLARVNGGLLRCLFQYSDEVPEFARLFSEANRRWYDRVTQSIIRRFPEAAADEAEIALAVHALGGMVDDFARRLYADHDAPLRALVDQVAPDDDALARFITRLWTRALYRDDEAEGGALALIGRRK